MPNRLRLWCPSLTSYGVSRRSAMISEGAKADRRAMLALGVLILAAIGGPNPPLRAQSAVAPNAAAADRSRRPMTLVDLLNIPRVLDPQMTTDGRRIAFTLRTADWPNNRRVDQIWEIRADGTGLRQITSTEAGVGAAKAWSPDGSSLAFLGRGTSPGLSIFVRSADGGATRQLSHHATGVVAPQPGFIAWAPDGASIYFIAAESPSEAERDRDKLRGDIYSYDDYRQQHLWKIGVADGQEQRLTSGDYSIVGFKVAANGTLIVNRAPTPLVLDSYLSEVWTMHADGGASVQLTHNKIAEGDASLSPDGSQVLFIARANDRQEPYYNANLFVVPAAGGPPRALVPTFPYEVLRAEWAADGKSVWTVVNMGVHSELFQFDVVSRKPRQITDGSHSIPEFNLARDKPIFTIDEPTRFGDVWSLDANATPHRVTGVYDYLDRDFLLPREEKIQWKGADGTPIEGLLFYPLDYKPGTRCPLAVVMHGGPEDSDKFSFGPVVWQGYQQVFAAKGYAVLKPNYRGSSGYGNAFYREPIGGYFKQSHLDVLAGVDRVIAMGVADPDKLVVMGYSAGGHLANKLITFTNRFKAAAVGAGASDWISLYGQTDTRADRDLWFGGPLWDKDAPINTYWENSPIKDAWKVRTPTLFVEGERDPRVPLAQAVEMFRALKAQGLPTRLDVVPLDAHTWVRPQHQLYKMNAELEWFATYALQQPYAFERSPAANDATVVPVSQ
jgi:dipeptidyl aminopeptidase/acylaminoacyl peptidase